MADAMPNHSIALVCDDANRVRNVLHNPSNLPTAAGEPFVDVFDQGSKEKALRLMQTIRDQEATFGWELLVRKSDQIILLRFAGTRVPEGILIAGAETLAYANALFDRLVQGQFRRPGSEDLSVRDQVKLFEQLAGLNNQLVTTQRELEKKNAALTRMLADRALIAAMAAHDLRSPLQVIMTAASALDGKPSSNANGAGNRELEMIHRNAAQMLSLVNDLLSAYSADIGMLELSMQQLDLETLTRSNAANNRPLAAGKKIALTFESRGPIPAVLGDPLRLGQVLNNLVHNAIKFSPEGSTIRVSLSKAGSDAVLAVEDEGVGMRQETLDALLHGTAHQPERVAQAEPGFGLGFVIIRSIVERHHGKIEGALLPNRGVRFSIRLPGYADNKG